MNEQVPKINVEQIYASLLRQKTIKPRLSLNLTEEDAYRALEASVKAEVAYRRRAYKADFIFEEAMRKTATWMITGKKVGIMLCGGCGNGKTTLALAIKNLVNLFKPKNAYGEEMFFVFYNAKEIAEFKKNAEKSKADNDKFNKLCYTPMLVIDDLGIEPVELMQYGNILNPVVDLITKRYEEQLITIITTNLAPTQVRERYGDRIADRFNEMLMVIPFTNTTFRV